jgi:hypothetical protein
MAKKQVLRLLGLLRPAASKAKPAPKKQTYGVPSGGDRPIVRRRQK